jgi:hypothetical protein
MVADDRGDRPGSLTTAVPASAVAGAAAPLLRIRCATLSLATDQEAARRLPSGCRTHPARSRIEAAARRIDPARKRNRPWRRRKEISQNRIAISFILSRPPAGRKTISRRRNGAARRRISPLNTRAYPRLDRARPLRRRNHTSRNRNHPASIRNASPEDREQAAASRDCHPVSRRVIPTGASLDATAGAGRIVTIEDRFVSSFGLVRSASGVHGAGRERVGMTRLVGVFGIGSGGRSSEARVPSSWFLVPSSWQTGGSSPILPVMTSSNRE